jgi:NitT/TauT family transport system ATP-binding protein
MNSSAGSTLVFDAVGMVYPDGTEALNAISFTVSPGEFVTVVGPSGCGKSTLLKLASGLLDHTSGEVSVDRARIGYVFQDATLLPWRNVQKNVELLAELNGIEPAERARRASEAISLVDLGGFERHHPKRLSGGMKMRVSLARSLTLDPTVFLFDEPFGALDEITRERLNDEVLGLFALKRFAGLFITHSIYEAIYMSTRVLVMSARPGRVIAEFAVPYGFPRDEQFRFSPEFAELSGQVSEALRMSYA